MNTTYTASQTEVINAITDGEARKMFFNGDSSKLYTSVMGCNGSAIKSLLKAGVIEKYNHLIYTQYYRMIK